jgi:hypothetical protein
VRAGDLVLLVKRSDTVLLASPRDLSCMFLSETILPLETIEAVSLGCSYSALLAPVTELCLKTDSGWAGPLSSSINVVSFF